MNTKNEVAKTDLFVDQVVMWHIFDAKSFIYFVCSLLITIEAW